MSGDWQHGLCGCFNNFGVCIVTYFAPCYTFGKSAEAVGDSCCMCGLVYFVPFLNFFALISVRRKIRDQHGIEGGLIGDCFSHLCCHFCALIQEAQEVRSPVQQNMVRC